MKSLTFSPIRIFTFHEFTNPARSCCCCICCGRIGTNGRMGSL